MCPEDIYELKDLCIAHDKKFGQFYGSEFEAYFVFEEIVYKLCEEEHRKQLLKEYNDELKKYLNEEFIRKCEEIKVKIKQREKEFNDKQIEARENGAQ